MSPDSSGGGDSTSSMHTDEGLKDDMMLQGGKMVEIGLASAE